MSEDKSKEWYKHGWGLVGAILFFPIFIIWYVWARSDWSKNIKIGVTAAMVVLIGIAAVTSPKSSETSNQNKTTGTQSQSATPTQSPAAEEKKAKYKASITATAVVNPATLRFNAKVKNTGNASGKFNCTVRAQDEGGTYKGFDFFSDDSDLQPGKTRVFNGILTITKEGAIFADQSSITCS